MGATAEETVVFMMEQKKGENFKMTKIDFTERWADADSDWDMHVSKIVDFDGSDSHACVLVEISGDDGDTKMPATGTTD
jgi:hypothetical protein